MKFQKTILATLLSYGFVTAIAQDVKFSIATDMTGAVSFKKDQRFIVIGQSLLVHFHFTGKDGAYVWYGYTAPGKFHNNFVATAKDISTNPQEMDFKSYSQISLRHLSIGWKHYLKGTYNSEESWSLYFTGGFGLVSGKATNSYTIVPDTLNYNFPSNPVNGEGKFKRLTFDAALGFEIPIGMEIYLYGEARAWIPASDYPSKYLFVNDNAPFIGTANLGLRILFD
ncbi:MAG: hypothetical protein QM764_05360 [Chitinophagaceae bacterium]